MSLQSAGTVLCEPTRLYNILTQARELRNQIARDVCPSVSSATDIQRLWTRTTFFCWVRRFKCWHPYIMCSRLSIQTPGAVKTTAKGTFSWQSWPKRAAMMTRNTGFHLVPTSPPVSTVWCTTVTQSQSLKIVSDLPDTHTHSLSLSLSLSICSSSHSTGQPASSQWQQKPSPHPKRHTHDIIIGVERERGGGGLSAGGYERFSAEYPFLRTQKIIYTPMVSHIFLPHLAFSPPRCSSGAE